MKLYKVVVKHRGCRKFTSAFLPLNRPGFEDFILTYELGKTTRVSNGMCGIFCFRRKYQAVNWIKVMTNYVTDPFHHLLLVEGQQTVTPRYIHYKFNTETLREFQHSYRVDSPKTNLFFRKSATSCSQEPNKEGAVVLARAVTPIRIIEDWK